MTVSAISPPIADTIAANTSRGSGLAAARAAPEPGDAVLARISLRCRARRSRAASSRLPGRGAEPQQQVARIRRPPRVGGRSAPRRRRPEARASRRPCGVPVTMRRALRRTVRTGQGAVATTCSGGAARARRVRMPERPCVRLSRSGPRRSRTRAPARRRPGSPRARSPRPRARAASEAASSSRLACASDDVLWIASISTDAGQASPRPARGTRAAAPSLYRRRARTEARAAASAASAASSEKSVGTRIVRSGRGVPPSWRRRTVRTGQARRARGDPGDAAEQRALPAGPSARAGDDQRSPRGAARRRSRRARDGWHEPALHLDAGLAQRRGLGFETLHGPA